MNCKMVWNTRHKMCNKKIPKLVVIWTRQRVQIVKGAMDTSYHVGQVYAKKHYKELVTRSHYLLRILGIQTIYK